MSCTVLLRFFFSDVVDGNVELDAELDRIAPAAALAAPLLFRILLWPTADADALALSEVFSGTL